MATKRRLMGDINVVPYIDVMLVLLVIFMVTAPMLVQGVDVELPAADAEPMAVKPNMVPVVVSINKKGELFINADGEKNTKTTDIKLRRTLIELLAERADRDIFIRGDKSITYDMLMQTMALMQQAGATNIGFVTDINPDDAT